MYKLEVPEELQAVTSEGKTKTGFRLEIERTIPINLALNQCVSIAYHFI